MLHAGLYDPMLIGLTIPKPSSVPTIDEGATKSIVCLGTLSSSVKHISLYRYQSYTMSGVRGGLREAVHSVKPSETEYSITRKELLAVVTFVKHSVPTYYY